ncbi:restriction endonuclease subunit S [Vibrio parahaemolyticus]|nr:restriction endonuclease subunit S [Vibrio parahaemolyticus]ELA8112456.1 restriction endonuclease subunit S [Vibrio parahaemolyticus]ELA8166188.1 restriction endonuclease subunit S [Vibrio parahaemolyticus]
MSNLKKHRFCELYTMSSGISSTKEQAGHGSPFLSFSTVFNNYFVPDELTDLMSTSEKEKETYSIKSGDIFLTRTSEVIDELAMSCVATKDYPNASYSGFLKRLRPTQTKVTYSKFMAFYLRSPMFRKTMTNNAVMTLRASLNEDIFSYLDLLLPDFDEQVKAGDLLYLLNEKIETNNRINTELEAMVKTLYDYWFVQFDFPDANGKPYKASGGKMVNNDLLKREIPDRWRVMALGDYANIKKGTLITEKDANTSGDVKVVSAGLDYSYCHDESNQHENVITVSASGASAGYVNFWREPIFACDCTTVRGKSDIESIYILHFLKMRQEYIYKQARGSAQPHVYPQDIATLNIEVPPTELLDKFGEKVLLANTQMTNLLHQNQELKLLIDWLLPMLMNGQVTVKPSTESKEAQHG